MQKIEDARANQDYVKERQLKKELETMHKTKADLQREQKRRDAFTRAKKSRFLEAEVRGTDYEDLDTEELLPDTDFPDDELEAHLFGTGPGRKRHFADLQALQTLDDPGHKPGPTPSFRMDPIVGDDKIRSWMHHNISVADDLRTARGRSYLAYLATVDKTRMENLQKLDGSSWMGRLGRLADWVGYRPGFLKSNSYSAEEARLSFARTDEYLRHLENLNGNEEKFRENMLDANIPEAVIDEVLKNYKNLERSRRADNAIGRVTLGGGAWVQQAQASNAVIVHPRSVGFQELVPLWERGLSVALHDEDEPGWSETYEFSVDNASHVAGASFLQVFIENAKCGCPSDKPALKYLQDITGLKTIKCSSTSATVTKRRVGRAHDHLFTGYSGNARTMLWTISPAVSVECSLVVVP